MVFTTHLHYFRGKFEKDLVTKQEGCQCTGTRKEATLGTPEPESSKISPTIGLVRDSKLHRANWAVRKVVVPGGVDILCNFLSASQVHFVSTSF